MPPKSSLASLLGSLTNAAPEDFDPEAIDADAGPSTFANDNDHSESDEEDDEEERINPRAHYADVGTSDLRRKAAVSESDKINDPKYQGVKSSRAELYADDDQDDEEITSDSEDVSEESASSASNSDEESEQDDAAGASGSASIAAQMAQSASQAKVLKARRLEDAEKGRQVRKQIKTFERALETRIKAQSVLREVNRLPEPEIYSDLMSSSSSVLEPAIGVLEQLLELSETLFSLRTKLGTMTSEEAESSAAPATRKRKRDFDIVPPEDNDAAASVWKEIKSHDQIDATISDVATYSASSDAYRRSVLDKWSLKVTSAAAAAAAASNGNKFTQLRAVNQTPSAQIDSALAGDGLQRLISRTRVLRSETEASLKLGHATVSTEDQKDAQVFDDSDFYSTLLKDLIERRSGAMPSGEGTTAAMMLNGLQGAKKKGAVDTRASKGRKLRYEVNDKIVNFMPPIKDRVRWGDEQIDRLFRQLASSSIGVVKDASQDEEEQQVDDEVADLGGLRMFG